ncbi:hypothetical protein Aduo_012033 [Ancylostoma duodenale]
MFCLRRNRRCNSATPAHPAPFCDEPPCSSPSYPVQQSLPQNPPAYSNAHLSCPISFYPDNLYGQGLEGALDRVDTRVTDALDGPNHYNQVRDVTIPLPPGVIAVQILQPTAPPYPTAPPQPPGYSQYPQYQHETVYPRLSQADQQYADQQMAAQK